MHSTSKRVRECDSEAMCSGKGEPQSCVRIRAAAASEATRLVENDMVLPRNISSCAHQIVAAIVTNCKDFCSTNLRYLTVFYTSGPPAGTLRPRQPLRFRVQLGHALCWRRCPRDRDEP